MALLAALAVPLSGCTTSDAARDDTGAETGAHSDADSDARDDEGAAQDDEDDSPSEDGNERPRDAGADARGSSTRDDDDDDSEAGGTGSDDDDEAAPDRSAGEAGADTLAARVCGERDVYPSPLPESTEQRMAKRVGHERFGFVEGPIWVEELGALLFSDMDFGSGNARGPAARIRRLEPPASYGIFVENAGSNGLALGADGAVLAATHDTQSLSAFTLPNGDREDFSIRFEGKRFNSPNDLTVRSDGTVYFTDPDWQLGARTSEIGNMGVYRVAPLRGGDETQEAELVDDTLEKPNGIALSPDERTLYVGSSGNEVWQYQVAEDGSVSGRTKFAEVGGSDGMAVDCAGNLYVTSQTIEVFARDGEKLGDIAVPETPSNAAFGGDDRKTLYITAQTGVYGIDLAVPGLPY